MDGLINLNKPRGISSAKALYRVRKITGVRKSGHAGTLDPAADGVLVLCLGKATKLVEALMDQPKVYRATARLDATSESFDADRPLHPVAVEVPPPADVVAAALRTFEGETLQVPPVISAIKIGGVPAYRRALRGQSPVLRPRPVRIYWTHVHSYAWPLLDFELACGRGTYVRALVRDLGERLGTGGVLTGLTRRRVGPFAVEEAWTLDAIAECTPRQVNALRMADVGRPDGLAASAINDFRIAAAGAAPPWLVPLQVATTLLESPCPPTTRPATR